MNITSLLKDIFSPQSKMQKWDAVEHTVVRDETYKKELDTIGYTIAKKLDESTLQKLKALYAETHNFNLEKGGMFYSVYSEDLNYRLKVHQTINKILENIYDSLFIDYKVIISSFIVKVNGPDSEFGLHQDSTGLDETKYSPISIWIPLQDTTIENGCLAVVPKSFGVFSPYRGISFPAPFHKIENEVKHFLQPIELKAGDVLIFDNRLIHYSPPNNSEEDRVVVMSGIFPNEANILSCYKDPLTKNDSIEIFQQEVDYLLTFKNFFHDCTCRPETGRYLGDIKWPQSEMKKNDFIHLMKEYNIPRISHPKLIQTFNSNIVPEPIQV